MQPWVPARSPQRSWSDPLLGKETDARGRRKPMQPLDSELVSAVPLRLAMALSQRRQNCTEVGDPCAWEGREDLAASRPASASPGKYGKATTSMAFCLSVSRSTPTLLNCDASSRPGSPLITSSKTLHPGLHPTLQSKCASSTAGRKAQSTFGDLQLQQAMRIERALNDLYLGLQVPFLGVPAPKQRSAQHKHQDSPEGLVEREPNRADAHKYFIRFCRLKNSPPNGSASQPASEETSNYGEASGEMAESLTPLPWSNFMSWMNQEAAFGVDQSYRRVCAGIARGAQAWRNLRATSLQRREGISIGVLLQWAYPSASDSDIAKMLGWIGWSEMQKLRQPSPKLIDNDERERLERVFHRQYSKGRGFTTAYEIGGGWNPDVTTQRSTLVDAYTASEVLGDGEVDLHKFLEVMCQYNHLGHENVKRVCLSGGSIILECRDAFDFEGWILEHPPKEELEQRHLVDGLEQEVLKWRSGCGS
eukprot:TRINITY_DN37001_c0_g1_i1.p1 TRINITY_DN37001_c0_g1~~TRINITY_DN37001_c0_g1_i1.p1  ORF type:complete len:497 (+),score=77.51 TRINITY_DN37001_c0_g1_i1:61-1491(+)